MSSIDPRSEGENRDVTASEIATFTYCAKAWHLEYVQKAEPSVDARTRRYQGVRKHDLHGRLIRTQSRLEKRRVAITGVLLLVALLALLAVFLTT